VCFYRNGVSVLVYWVYVLTRRVVKVKQSMLIVYIASAFLIIIGLFDGGINLVYEGLNMLLRWFGYKNIYDYSLVSTEHI